ncbi:metallophosphoesterase [Marinimicrobium agarilyticum]|uniref:metallophosphoesterase n=1 Tax=Marinimicrobium agarilyticum TaxID=306546 RepID=UPI00068895AE|nr:metallophosphoesterase [Marinimicrobium agarilyticum]
MPDIHFHDVYATFEDGSFDGIENSISGERATIRTMQAQMTSTRLFNESYFALLAALDDVVDKGITLVALPGDFSDDGQPIHIRGLRRILERYHREHGIEFFATPGNHDPVRPFDTPGGESDFLGADGREQRIYSKGAQECVGYDTDWALIDSGRPLKTICTEEIRHLGYEGIMTELGDFGFYPKPNYRYWETPYSHYEHYTFEQARKQSVLEYRQFEICRNETERRNCHQVPDASYLVEPVPGLWLLAIDANVYIPKADAGDGAASQRFDGSGNAGYNAMLSHKRHVLDWVREVVERAERSQKQLIAFSHFPMTEFYDNQSDAIATLFGTDTFQLKRRPKSHVSQVLAETGLKVHVGGHMHMNDTGIVRTEQGNTLVNIQAPSLAAYLPAYKVLTLHSARELEVETIVLDEVPRFAELFEHYQREHQLLEASERKTAWSKGVLDSTSYREFTEWHLRELTRQRFLPKEWPESLKQRLLALTGDQLLAFSQWPENESLESLQRHASSDTENWRQAQERARTLAQGADLQFESFAGWTGFELAVDFYRLRNAGSLALNDIDRARLLQYELLARAMKSSEGGVNQESIFRQRLAELLAILQGLKVGEPDNHFRLHLDTGEVMPWDSQQSRR